MSPRIWLRRAYDAPTRNDGRRVLVDRIWPRGVSRDEAAIDVWCRDLAPSDELRAWFGHEVERWEEFQRRYREELGEHTDHLEQLVDWTHHGRITVASRSSTARRIASTTTPFSCAR